MVDLPEVTRKRLQGGDAEGGPSKKELYRRAREKDIPGRSRMTKDELGRAVQKAG